MPASKAQQKAVTKYVKSKYDRFGLTMPKGNLDIKKAHAEARSESVNGFIGPAIDETMGRDSGGTASEIAQRAAETAQESGVVSPLRNHKNRPGSRRSGGGSRPTVHSAGGGDAGATG